SRDQTWPCQSVDHRSLGEPRPRGRAEGALSITYQRRPRRPPLTASAMSFALGSAQLSKLRAFLDRRALLASHYDEILDERSESVVRPRRWDRGTWGPGGDTWMNRATSRPS